MKNQGLFSVHAFAKLSRTTRDTLHHYDKIGLLTPASRGANNYRYYSSAQLSIANMIRTLQDLGMSLAEIKAYKENRAPGRANDLLTHQIRQIDLKIEEWVKSRQLLLTLRKAIRSADGVDERAVSIQFLPAEPIVMGGLNDYSQGRNDYDALLSFYNDMKGKHPEMDLNYPVWGVHSGKNLKERNMGWPDRYYFFHPGGQDKRPAGQYVVGYARGGYGQNADLYERLLAYIDGNGLEIAGDAYEEYPLNEVCVSDPSNYLIRVLIAVGEKK